MQYGIYYAYWETEWGGNFVPYVEKCAAEVKNEARLGEGK